MILNVRMDLYQRVRKMKTRKRTRGGGKNITASEKKRKRTSPPFLFTKKRAPFPRGKWMPTRLRGTSHLLMRRRRINNKKKREKEKKNSKEKKYNGRF